MGKTKTKAAAKGAKKTGALDWIIDGLRPLAVPIDSVKLDSANENTHNDASVEAIAASLKRYKQRTAIVVNEKTKRIAKGNGTWLAAKQLGWTHIAAVLVKEDAKSHAGYRLADNRTAELSEWDDEKLAESIAELGKDEPDLFAALKLDELLASLPDTGEVSQDEVPATPKTATTKKGDLWILGEHRLLCGDATVKEDVVRLMNGKRAELMNTDPPYGISYDSDDLHPNGKKGAKIANDELCDQELQAFLEKCFTAAANEALLPNAAWYLWHAHLTQGFFAAAAAAAANVVLHRQIIWVKPILVFGRGQYHWKHEPCFMGWVKGKQPPDYGRGAGERDQTTVWEIDGVGNDERKEFDHSTPKPVELFAIPIVKHTKSGAVVYEPFSGSAPQIIAAEQLGRRCYAMEIEPRYCDVAVERWQNLTGGKAKRAKG